ncbi:hypothetical protein GVanDAA622_09500 [Enterococcus faecium]|nr:hypothetical protein GVanDAA622_09500 [Enterococcus faecium]
MKSIFKASELELTRERKEHFLEKYGCDSKLSAACDILENGFEDAIQILSFLKISAEGFVQPMCWNG